MVLGQLNWFSTGCLMDQIDNCRVPSILGAKRLTRIVPMVLPKKIELKDIHIFSKFGTIYLSFKVVDTLVTCMINRKEMRLMGTLKNK